MEPTSRPIKVAQIIGMSDGGVASCILNYYRHIDKSKIQFDFFVESESKIIDKEEIESMGGRVMIIPSYKHVFKYMKTLKKLFIEGKYDIVHSNMNSLSVFTLRAAKKARIKVRISHSHSTSNKKEWKKNIMKNMLRPFSKKYATHYFACSEHAGRWLFGNKTYKKGFIKIINNAIDLDKFMFNEMVRKEIRNELNIPDDSYVIGHVGRFMQQKNHEFLIDVFYRFQTENDNSILLLIGSGPLMGDIKNKIKELNIEDKVIFTGLCSNVYEYYNAMDLFLFPSLYEGLGMTLVEAQVNGLNCIASNFIPKEALVNNVHVCNLNIIDWINEIRELKNVDRNNTRDYFELFDIKKESNTLLSIYQDFIKDK